MGTRNLNNYELMKLLVDELSKHEGDNMFTCKLVMGLEDRYLRGYCDGLMYAIDLIQSSIPDKCELKVKGVG